MDRQASGRGEGGFVAAPKTPGFVLDGHLARNRGAGLSGLALGAQVATLEGMLPVEYLSPGDRIVTRAGARVLRGLSTLPLVTQLVCIAPGALGHDRPTGALMLGAGTQVLVRDWRAQAMFGTAQALVAVARLVDGHFVTRVADVRTRLFTLHFDAPEVIYAEGVEVGCQPLRLHV